MSMLMKTAAPVVAVSLFWSTLVSHANAEIRDYEFRLVKAEMKKGDAEVAVRLVNKKTGKPVPNAVIFAKRIDMAPDGMATMAAPIEQLPSTEPGVYRFKTNLSMAGPLAAVARREGPGRDRHRSRASWSLKAAAMRRTSRVLVVLAAVSAAGIGGFWLGHRGDPLADSRRLVSRRRPAGAERSGHLLPGPRRQAALFG